MTNSICAPSVRRSRFHWNLTLAIALLSGAAFAQTVAQSQLSKGSADLNCNPPASVASFTTNDREIWAYFLVDNGAAGDVARVDWLDPNNNIARSTSFSPLPSAGNWCQNSDLSASGDLYTPTPGNWKVRLVWNTVVIATIPFPVVSAGPAPTITSISQILPLQTQTITISGRGFGTMSPYVGDSSYIHILDVTGQWNAGFSGDPNGDFVTLSISSWTDSQIVIQGFLGSYGFENWSLVDGDEVQVQIWNPQTGAGPGAYQVSVGGQAAPVFSLSASSASFTASSGTGTVGVTAIPATASWTAASNASWITITSGASGTGSGTVAYSVSANTATSARTGTLLVAGLTYTVAQAAASGPAQNGPISALWTNTEVGTLDGVGFLLSSLSGSYLISSAFTSPDFAAAPLPNVNEITYSAGESWTVTFAAPVTNLLLYLDEWRGAFTSPGPDPTSTYTFSQPFSIFSGLGGTTVAGNTLSIPGNAFYSGILEFPGPITSLTVNPVTPRYDFQGLTFGLPGASVPGVFTINPTSYTVNSGTNSGSVDVTANSSTASWTATSNASWITILSGASGIGNGLVVFSVAANPAAASRTGTLTIAGLTFTVTQTAAASPTTTTFGPGDQLIETFTAAPNSADLLLLFNNDPLTVTGSPIFTTQLYDGQTLLGTYTAGPSTYNGLSYFSTSFAAPGSGLAAGSLTDAVTVSFTSINNGTIAGRLVTTVAGGSVSGFNRSDLTFYDAASISDGYEILNDISANLSFIPASSQPASFSLSPTSASVTANPTGGSVSVTATPSTAAWTATSNASWISITSGATGAGNGTVNYSVAANTSPSARTGTITIAGLTFTVSQAGGQSTSPPTSVTTTRTWTYTWSNGLLASAQSPRTDVNDLTQYSYDNSGALTSTTNALGQVTKVTRHTPGGLPQTIVDANGVTTQLTYDARLRLSSSTINTAAGPLTTTYTYDPAGNLVTVTQPDGSSLTSTYDAAHRLTAITDVLNQSTTYTLDALGNRTQAQVADASGNTQRNHSANFDPLGRMIQDIGGAKQTAGFAYDANGNRSTITDPLNRNTQQAFDELNRLTQITDPASGVTQTSYDAHDRPTSVTAANGATTSYTYDGFGNMIQRVSPDSGTTQYSYDASGNLIQKTDARGVVTSYAYDALNRLTSRTYPGNSAENVTLTYDESGHGFGVSRLTSIKDAVGKLSRSYDERGNLLSEARVNASNTLLTSYSYDAASRIASITYPSGWMVAYSRDSMGRTVSMSAQPKGGAKPMPLVSNVGYQPFGPVSSMTFGNGVTESRGFDLDYRLTTLGDAGNSPVQNLAYNYDSANNVKSVTDGVNSSNSQAFGYDALDRLTSATGNYGILGYKYDPVGNRLSETRAGKATVYTYTPNSNRLASTAASGTAQTIGYTAAGDITSLNPDGGSAATGYLYNQSGRLATANSGAQMLAQYTYDAFGQRLTKVGSTTGTTLYSYDFGGHLLEELDGNGNTLADYVYLDATPIASISPSTGSVYFLHNDRLGTPQLATDASQNVQWMANYEPFGKMTNSSALIVQDLRLPGQEQDVETGLNHNGFRDYAPGLGRYVQSDPIGLTGGVNTYAYADSKPFGATDRMGLSIADWLPPAYVIRGVSETAGGVVEMVGALPAGAGAGALSGPFAPISGALVATYLFTDGWASANNGINHLINDYYGYPHDQNTVTPPFVSLVNALGGDYLNNGSLGTQLALVFAISDLLPADGALKAFLNIEGIYDQIVPEGQKFSNGNASCHP